MAESSRRFITEGKGYNNATILSPTTKRRLGVQDYTVGWVCALPIEHAAATMMLDEEHEDPPQSNNDTNLYTLGRIFGHNVVITCLPAGLIGSTSATAAAIEMKSKFPKIQFGLLVGVGGGVPSVEDIRLGDVVISQPLLNHGGVVQYDSGKSGPSGFIRTGFLNTPPKFLLNAVSKLRSNHLRGKNTILNHLAAINDHPNFARENAGEDVLFKPTSPHAHIEGIPERTCENCNKEEVIERHPRSSQDVIIHYGTIASGGSLIRDALIRDALSSQLGGVICFEMEAAGLMNHFPCLVIRGICDYADSHKNKKWQPYAAATAAAYAKEILSVIRPTEEQEVEFSNTKLQSDSIFLQQRLLVREDVQSFLAGAFCQNGSVRVALHGLPGVGKSTMARYFAYENRDQMAILWITASSNETIVKGFEQYARQIHPGPRDFSEPVSIVRQALSRRFSERWLLVLDGSDDTNINIEKYIFNDLSEAKVLITTRYTQVASHIGATHILQLNTLDRNKGQDLLSRYISSTPAGNSAQEEDLSGEEAEARKQLVKELGGLPLAISIIGAALRNGSCTSNMNCQRYLQWPAEVQDSFLAQDPQFSDYPSSVWKAFAFAFQRVLSGMEQAASMAYFIASCDNAWNIADYFQLYRQFESFVQNKGESRQPPGLEKIRFLKDGFFELAINQLAAMNMVTCSWASGSSPYIEMHLLVRRWIKRVNSDQVLSYIAQKLRLVGFGIYSHMLADQTRDKQFKPLMNEIKASMNEIRASIKQSPIDPAMGKPEHDTMPDIALPFLLPALKFFRQTIDKSSTRSVEIRQLRGFSEALESEMKHSFHVNFTGKDIDWEIFSLRFTKSMAKKALSFITPLIEEYSTKDQKWDGTMLPAILPGFWNILGSQALEGTILDRKSWASIGCTGLIQDIEAKITAEVRDSIGTYLSQDSNAQAQATISEDPRLAIDEWVDRWGTDFEEIIRRCFQKVVTQLCRDNMEEKGTATPNCAESGSMKNRECPQTIEHSQNFMKVFFSIVHQAARAGAGYCLRPKPRLLNYKSIFGLFIQNLHDQMAENRFKELFGVSWKPPDPARVKQVEDFAGDSVTLFVAYSLKVAAQEGFAKAFEQYHPPGVAAKLALAVFSNEGVGDLFQTLDLRNRSDLPPEIEDPDEEMAASIQLINDAREYAFQAMKVIYSDQSSTCNGSDLVLTSITLTLKCRDKLLYATMASYDRQDLVQFYSAPKSDLDDGTNALVELSQAIQILGLKSSLYFSFTYTWLPGCYEL